MPTFPTLSINPSVTPWEEGAANDPTLRSPFEAGYVQTRARFTRIPDRWHIGYTLLPKADKDTLRAFEKTVKVGSDSFTWTNPDDQQTYTVRFLAPISYKPVGTMANWHVEFVLEEV